MLEDGLVSRRLLLLGTTFIAIGVTAWLVRSIDVPGVEVDDFASVGEALEQPGSLTQQQRREARQAADEAYLAQDPPVEEAPFRLGFARPGALRLHFEMDGGYCVGARHATKMFLDHVDVVETTEAVTLTPYLTSRRNTGLCAGIGDSALGEVSLDSPLGDRVVLDGTQDPPAERSPTNIRPAGVSRPALARLEPCAGTFKSRFGRRTTNLEVTGLSCRRARSIARHPLRQREFTCIETPEPGPRIEILCGGDRGRAFRSVGGSP